MRGLLLLLISIEVHGAENGFLTVSSGHSRVGILKSDIHESVEGSALDGTGQT